MLRATPKSFSSNSSFLPRSRVLWCPDLDFLIWRIRKNWYTNINERFTRSSRARKFDKNVIYYILCLCSINHNCLNCIKLINFLFQYILIRLIFMIVRNAVGLFLFPQKIQEYIYYINGYIRAYRPHKQ